MGVREKRCLQCGVNSPKGANFCVNCGESF
jgi:hypothetical protein